MTQSSPDPGTSTAESTSNSSRLVAIFSEIVAPTAFVGALLFYFGWARAFAYYNYFGIHLSVLSFSQQELLMRSVDALYVPLGFVGIVGLVAAWAYTFARHRSVSIVPMPLRHLAHVLTLAIPAAFRTRIAWLWRVAAIGVPLAVAILLVANGLAGLLNLPTPINRTIIAAAPVTFILGVLIVSWLVNRHRLIPNVSTNRRRFERPGLVESGFLIIVIGLNAFWAADDYAEEVGRARAIQFAETLHDRPLTYLYTESRLHLVAATIAGSGVREAVCANPPGASESKPTYRYEGLVLVIQAADQVVLVPRTWTPKAGTAIVLSKGSGGGAPRLEFQMPGINPPTGNC
ncbi:hypothetical protein ACWIGI_28775 [Nocardia sp. NPDC055321]